MVEQFFDWDKWKDSLRKAIELGQKIGFEEETIVRIARKIGDLLNLHADPENREQRLIKELWDVADEAEQKILTKHIIKMLKKEEALVKN